VKSSQIDQREQCQLVLRLAHELRIGIRGCQKGFT
jgi:hypothetical protein